MGLNLNLPVPNSFDNLFKYIIFIPSNVSNVVPGVILPGLLLILLYANINISTFFIILNKLLFRFSSFILSITNFSNSNKSEVLVSFDNSILVSFPIFKLLFTE